MNLYILGPVVLMGLGISVLILILEGKPRISSLVSLLLVLSASCGLCFGTYENDLAKFTIFLLFLVLLISSGCGLMISIIELLTRKGVV